MSAPDLRGLAARESAAAPEPGSVVAEALALLAAATPGPWEVSEYVGQNASPSQELAVCAFDDPRSYQKPDGTWHAAIIARGMDGPTREPNATLIAAAPRLLAALADECERLSAALAAATERAERAERERTLLAEGNEAAKEIIARREAALGVANQRARDWEKTAEGHVAEWAKEKERAERAEQRERAAELREERARRDLDFVRSIPAMDALVCTACGRTGTLDGSWRWTGEVWEHHCPDAGQGGHFPAERTADALARERGRADRAEARLAPLERVAEAARAVADGDTSSLSADLRVRLWKTVQELDALDNT